MTSSNQVLELTIRRVLRFPRDRVFQAWLDKEALCQWMGPSQDVNLQHIEHDPRPSGKFRFGFVITGQKDPEFVHGEFLEISPPSRLVFTWIWEPPVREAGAKTVVEVDFADHEEGTKLVLTHTRFPDSEARDRHHQGWNGTLKKMDTYLHRSAQ